MNNKEIVLITGQAGFVGQHLVSSIAAHVQWASRFPAPRTPDYDLLLPETIDRCLAEVNPDAVIHLAGQTSVPKAIANPAETLQVNLLGTLNLLQALKRNGFRGVFLYVSSGDIYGRVAESNMPITENEPPRPQNPYAVSKAAAELLCLQWSRVEPWRILIARPFNHIGAGQRPDFVISEIARQILAIKRGRQSPRLQLGDIDVSRDFLDVSDVIAAYMALLASGANGEIYNVCTGHEFVVRELAETMLSLAGVTATIERDPARFRPADQRRVAGDNAKLRAATSWQPHITINESLQTVLRDWETRSNYV